MSKPMLRQQFLLGLVGVVGFSILLTREIADRGATDGRVAITAVLLAGCAFNLVRGLAGLLGGKEHGSQWTPDN
jgi:hypothetical protein